MESSVVWVVRLVKLDDVEATLNELESDCALAHAPLIVPISAERVLIAWPNYKGTSA